MLTFEQVIVNALDPRSLASWWKDALQWGWSHEDENGDVEIRIDENTLPALMFVSVPEPKTVLDRLHLDFRPSSGEQDAEVARLIASGATRADVGQGPEVTWVVLADPEGNEFCIL